MGLAAPQARLLTLTRRKSDCEFRISQNATEKMSLTREQSKLANEYYSMLNSKRLSYIHNGEYQTLDYTYLMGRPGYQSYVNSDSYTKKQNYNMVLTDSKGLVVIDNFYAKRFMAAGLSVDKNGKGRPFGQDEIANVLAQIINATDVDMIKTVIGGGTVKGNYTADSIRAYTGETVTADMARTADLTEMIQERIAYYYPIVLAAATNGWTTEYNSKIDPTINGQKNPAYEEDYINDALISGFFQLAVVDDEGCYNPDTSLAYFTTCGTIVERTDSDERERLTAWYNAERSRLTEKETYLDIENGNLSTELESLKTSITSLESFIKDAITSVFDWGNA